MTFSRSLLVLTLAAASASAAAVDARERGFIRQGMAEGEVLFRIGKPDHETFVRDVKGQAEEKTWTYFPDSRDAQTLDHHHDPRRRRQQHRSQDRPLAPVRCPPP